VTGRPDAVWQSSALVHHYLQDVRRGVPLAAEQIEVMLRILAAGQRPIQRFLDLGCGGGILSAAVLARFPDATGVLLDFSPPMIQAAQAGLQTYGDQLHFVTADYGDPGWVDSVSGWAPFDAVVSGYSIHHRPDDRKLVLYGELYNLLVPGGFFINVEHVASRSPWAEEIWEAYFIDSLHDSYVHNGVAKSREQVVQEYHARPDRGANILAPVEAQCEWLRAIGFAEVDCFFKAFELAVFGGRRREEAAW
jgi:tRNA (cmo5U34)-methyltransferase